MIRVKSDKSQRLSPLYNSPPDVNDLTSIRVFHRKADIKRKKNPSRPWSCFCQVQIEVLTKENREVHKALQTRFLCLNSPS